MNEHLLKSLESSVNKMGVALRIQFERWTEITDKFKIDKNDAITNFEHSFDGVLETVHSVDDNLRKLKLVEKQNTVLRFLNLIRNIRHHDSSKLPFSLTKNILTGIISKPLLLDSGDNLVYTSDLITKDTPPQNPGVKINMLANVLLKCMSNLIVCDASPIANRLMKASPSKTNIMIS